MITPSRLIRRIRSLFATTAFDTELDEEMRFHIEMEAAKLVNAGMDEQLARETARRDFGGFARHRDEARDARGVRPVEDLLHDLRVGVRVIAKQRTYAVVAIATLAIGIGATTALWAAVYRVLLEPFPFPEADRIVTVWQNDTRAPSRAVAMAPGNYADLKERNRTFAMLAAAEPWSFDFMGREGPERFGAALVTKDFFAIQGLRPLLGRTFLPEEFEPGRDNVVLLSETAWRTRFGTDSSVIGRSLALDTLPKLVVGVMSDDAMRPFDAEVWAPKVLGALDLRQRASGYWNVIGRLAPNTTFAQAEGDVRRIAAELAEEYPATNRTTGGMVVTLRDAVAGDSRRSLLVLFGAVAFVMLIACVNVANLQLAECIRRQRELAVRTAIGAGRGRLVRQLLAESGLIAAIGSVVAMAIAWWGIASIRAFAPSDLWLLQKLTLNAPTLLFAAALAALCGVAITVPPMFAVARIRLSESLAAGRRTGAGKERRRANRFLVVSEVALALVLMVGAGLLLRSLSVLLRSDAGFDPRGVAVADLQSWQYFPAPQQRAEFVRLATERLAQIPGVTSAGMGSSLPLQYPIGQERARMTIEGNPVGAGDEVPTLRATAATAGYFETLRIPLISGRPFGPADIGGSANVALVNATFAKRFFGDQSPIGKHVTFGFVGAPVTREIVGVVGDVRHVGLHEAPAPGVFIPHAQAPTGATQFVLRVKGEPGSYERAIRAALSEMNRSMPIGGVTTMEALLDRSLRERRFQMGLLTAFSSIALLLSAIGIYGIMSRATSERTHEIGVRLAIGAEARDVRWMVLRNGGGLAMVGIAIGFALAFLLTRYMSGMLFGVTALDPLTYVGSSVVLLLAAVLATWVPAWRASTVDPVVALRND